MTRAEKDSICRDRAGVERFVAFGSDIPAGWKYVRDAEGSVLPSDAAAPRTIGNVDAAAVRTERLEAEAERSRSAEAGARAQVGPSREGSPRSYDDMNVEDLQAQADSRGLEVEGTGKDGNVLKADLVAALEADDAA